MNKIAKCNLSTKTLGYLLNVLQILIKAIIESSLRKSLRYAYNATAVKVRRCYMNIHDFFQCPKIGKRSNTTIRAYKIIQVNSFANQ